MAVLQAFFNITICGTVVEATGTDSIEKRGCRLIHFMIDFENTRNKGLQGAEYLQPDDSVTIFYSQVCMKIERKWFCQLTESGCSFKICKLQKAGKNALDFYIASRIGEMYGQGYIGRSAIVSNDAGFRAVKEYWKSCADVPRDIILRPNIEQCIFSSGENSFRQRQISVGRHEIDLEDEYRKYGEQQRIRKGLEEIFAHTDYERMIEQIMHILESSKPLRILYLDSVKQFGKRDGLRIYHKVKQII